MPCLDFDSTRGDSFVVSFLESAEPGFCLDANFGFCLDFGFDFDLRFGFRLCTVSVLDSTSLSSSSFPSPSELLPGNGEEAGLDFDEDVDDFEDPDDDADDFKEGITAPVGRAACCTPMSRCFHS